VNELVDGQQLDRGDAEALEVLDDGGMREPRIGAAQRLGHVWVQVGQSLDVGLVDDRVGERCARRSVVAPVEGLFSHDGAGDVWSRVGGVAPVDGRVPLDAATDGAGVGIEEQLGRVAAQTGVRVPRAVDPEAVTRAVAGPGHVTLPDAAIGELERMALLAAAFVEEADVHAVGDAAEHREANAVALAVRAGPHLAARAFDSRTIMSATSPVQPV
jgi:hypothetical protein